MLSRAVRAAWNYSRWYTHCLVRGRRACRSYVEFRVTEFDRAYGIETSATLAVEELGEGLSNRSEANHYGPIMPDKFRALVRATGVDPREYTFVDLGSGKGRALVLAAEAGFKSVIGVEFSPVLHAMAVANLAIYRHNHPAGKAVAPLCQDAAAYTYPPGPLAVFFFNSFRGRVLETVLANLAAASATSDPVYLLWNGVQWFTDIRDTIESCPHLVLLADRDNYRVYRVRKGSTP